MLHQFIGPAIPAELPNPIPVDTSSADPISSRYATDVRYRCFADRGSEEVGRPSDEKELLPRKRHGQESLDHYTIATMPIDCTSPPSSYDEVAQRQYDCLRYMLTCGKLRSSQRAVSSLRAIHVTPSAACYSALLQQCVREGNPDVALDTYEALNVVGQVSKEALKLVLTVLEKSQRPLHAAALLMDRDVVLEDHVQVILAGLVRQAGVSRSTFTKPAEGHKSSGTTPNANDPSSSSEVAAVRVLHTFLTFIERHKVIVDVNVCYALAIYYAERSELHHAIDILKRHVHGGASQEEGHAPSTQPIRVVPENVVQAVLKAVLYHSTSHTTASEVDANARWLLSLINKNSPTFYSTQLYASLIQSAYRAGSYVEALALFHSARKCRMTTPAMFLEIMRVVLASSNAVLVAVTARNKSKSLSALDVYDEMKSTHDAVSVMPVAVEASNALSAVLRSAQDESDIVAAARVLREMADLHATTSAGESCRCSVGSAVQSTIQQFFSFVETHRHLWRVNSSEGLLPDDVRNAMQQLSGVMARNLLSCLLTCGVHKQVNHVTEVGGGASAPPAYLRGSAAEWFVTNSASSSSPTMILQHEGVSLLRDNRESCTLVLVDITSLLALTEGDFALRFAHMMSDYYLKSGGFCVVPFSTLLQISIEDRRGVIRLLLQWSSQYPWLRFLPPSAHLELIMHAVCDNLHEFHDMHVSSALFSLLRTLHKRTVFVVRSLTVEAYSRVVLQLKPVQHLHTLMDRIAVM